MITLDLPPQTQAILQTHAQAYGISVNDYILKAIQDKLADDTPNSLDNTMVFDVDTMKERLKGFESREDALKNGLMLPQGLGRDGLMAWLNDNLAKPNDKAVVCE